MKHGFLAAVVALIASVAPAFAADEATAMTHAGRGIVKSVSIEDQTVRMEHEPIASLKWPKMTMNFRAHEAALLQGLSPDLQVEFELAKFGSRYEIIRIAPLSR